MCNISFCILFSLEWQTIILIPLVYWNFKRKNGIDIRIRLRSCASTTKIINGISINMKMKNCQLLKQIIGKLSVLIDESTSVSIKIALKVYLSGESKEVDPYFMVFKPNWTAWSENLKLFLSIYWAVLSTMSLITLVVFTSNRASIMFDVGSDVITIHKKQIGSCNWWFSGWSS